MFLIKKSALKFILIPLVVVALLAAAVFVSALVGGDVNNDGKINVEDAFALVASLVSSEGGQDLNGDSEKDIRDANALLDSILAVGPRLTSLSVDGDTAISFDPETFIYTVGLPTGRPRVPRVTASAASGSEVKICQATFADGQTEGMAKVIVKDASGETTYQVRFVKKAENGFQLQYDDRYTFSPAYVLAGGESFTFTSSNPSVASVTPGGVITALDLSSAPVTITAKVDGVEKDSLVIDKIVKAQIAVFLITGQSNAAGSCDADVDYAAGYAIAARPAAGTSYCMDVQHNGTILAAYDMKDSRKNPSATGVPGFAPALAKEWYELSGEKVFCIHSAVGGSPIENWEKNGDPYYGNGSKNLYDNTFAAYEKVMAEWNQPNGKYERVRTHYYWCQGETAMASHWDVTKPGWVSGGYIMTADDYYARFTANHAHFREDMDVSIGGIMLVRATSSVSSAESKALQLLTDLVPARAAQYALNNTNGDSIVIASRICDIARMESSTDKTSPGYGYMGPANLHYLQAGYNAQGVEMAQNTFKMINAFEDRSATEIEIIDSNGRTRFAEGDVLKLEPGEEHQITAIVLPLYTEAKKITYSITGGSWCTIDIYGMIRVDKTAAAGSAATLTVTAQNGMTKSITLRVAGSTIVDVHYRWDFDAINSDNTINSTVGEGLNSNKLTPSAKSTNVANAAKISDGILTLSGKTVDYAMEHPIWLSTTYDWTIEWRGKLSSGSALLGTEGATNNFLYLAYGVSAWNYPFRIVSDTGSYLHIPYGATATADNTSWNTWKAVFTASNKTMTLYRSSTGDNWTTVGSVTASSTMNFNFTNVFGRYIDSANVNYTGSIDYLDIIAKEKIGD